MIGASRPAVNRAPQSPAARGLIAVEGRTIVLRDIDGLRRRSGLSEVARGWAVSPPGLVCISAERASLRRVRASHGLPRIGGQMRTQAPLLMAHFLGKFRVAVDGVLVDTESSRRTRHVLAYLLAHRRYPVPRDVLMEAFWPAAERKAVQNRLHVALSGVRQALRAASPDAIIERRFDTYRLAGRAVVWSDMEHIEHCWDAGRRADRAGDLDTVVSCYEAGCQLYQGDFLVEDPYLEWAAAIRERLRFEAVETQSRLLEIYLERRQHGAATLLGRRLLAVDPCNERVHRQLMACYAASGQRHLALSQYHQLESELWQTFRVLPSAETTALNDWLRRPQAQPRPA
jgi:DNA-binding SARP family transcriptional activator